MEKLSFSFLSMLLVLIIALQIAAQERISPAEATKYIGKTVTVCGQVASANFAARNRRRPTFLNLDRAYPNHIFTALIWGDDRANFLHHLRQPIVGRKSVLQG
jgi:hypothetical protein